MIENTTPGSRCAFVSQATCLGIARSLFLQLNPQAMIRSAARVDRLIYRTVLKLRLRKVTAHRY